MVAELLDRGVAVKYASWFRALADPSRVPIVEYLARQGRHLTHNRWRDVVLIERRSHLVK